MLKGGKEMRAWWDLAIPVAYQPRRSRAVDKLCQIFTYRERVIVDLSLTHA